MAYIGRPLNAGNLAVQSGTGDGSDTTPIATLDYSVGSSNSIAVYLDGVRQLAGTDFTATGTTLTFTTAPASGVGIDVYFLGLELSIPTPADRSVTLAKMATGTDGNIISYDASGNPVAIATGNDGQVLTSAGAGAPPAFETLSAGKVLQVVSATKTDTTTNTGTSFATISGLSVDITPAATSSKVLVIWNVNVNGNNDGSCIGIIRESTLIALGDSSGSTIQCTANTHTTNASEIKNVAGSHLDSPSSTSEQTYAVQWKSEGGTDYLNRAESEGTSSRCVSSITVMEIGA